MKSPSSRFDRTSKKTSISRLLRRSMTPAERLLWKYLRNNQFRGLGVRRQHPMGSFVLDFYCPALRLAVELDGDHHGWPSQVTADLRRDIWLKGKGVYVLRFWNNEVLANLEGVLTTLYDVASTLQQRIPTPALPFARGGGDDVTSPRKGEVGAKRRVGIDFEREPA